MKVLLYSGGMDSYVLYRTINFDNIIYFDIGTADSKKEMELLPQGAKIIKLPLSSLELENKIIPWRNAFFVLYAASYGDKIYLGATKGDTTKDKDYVFKSSMETILRYFALDADKVPIENPTYEVMIPFKSLTKSEIVRCGLEHGITKKEFRTATRSCYRAENKECGKCRSCLRKAVAYQLNDIRWNDLFIEYPFSLKVDEKQLSREGEGLDYHEAMLQLDMYY